MAKVFRQQALFPVISSRKFVQLALTIAVITCLVSSIDGLKDSSSASTSSSNSTSTDETTTSTVSKMQPVTVPSAPSAGSVNPSSTNSSGTPSPTVASTGATEGFSLPVLLPISTARPLLGINGTGQRLYNVTLARPVAKPTVVSDPISVSNATVGSILGNSLKPDPPTPSSSPFSAGLTKPDAPSTSVWDRDFINIDNVDNVNYDQNKTLLEHNITQITDEYHTYYNSTSVNDVEAVRNFYSSFDNLTTSHLLSKSHRRAMTVQLQFDFPFYGNPIRNITIATGGFIYTGEYVHSWLAATQYIAPLMANFDTSLSNESMVKYYDNGTSITVLWENVLLQDHAKTGGPFSFSATLHKNGDIIFGYYSIPMAIEAIEDKKHPVKVGLSDAYISDKTIFFARRKTIYEYHRVTFDDVRIRNNTLIILKAETTCISITDCAACLELNTFKCGWCPTLNRCSTGIDRKRHDWLQRGCDKGQIVSKNECPALGQKGNNAADKAEASGEYDLIDPRPTVHGSKTATDTSNDAPQMSPIMTSSADHSQEKGGISTAMGVLIPMCMIILAISWIVYAYRNPHTKSGQLLIQYRPSQWSWRRGEARYTAATIHM